jgi:hypothetical protein
MSSSKEISWSRCVVLPPQVMRVGPYSIHMIHALIPYTSIYLHAFFLHNYIYQSLLTNLFYQAEYCQSQVPKCTIHHFTQL